MVRYHARSAMHRNLAQLLAVTLFTLASAAPAQSQPASDPFEDLETNLDRETEFLEDRWLLDLPEPVGLDAEYEGLDVAEEPEQAPDELGYEAYGVGNAPIPDPYALSFDPGAIHTLPFDLQSVHHAPLLEFLEFYNTEGRSRATRWMTAAGRYRGIIEAIAHQLDAPPEILWVAAVESAFTPDARSHAGAVGMWQFMSRSAIGQGMRIDSYVDERLDPILATRYGIGYLLDRYETFGTWPLAFAAYNAGGGHVRGELREYGVTDFWVMDRYSCLYGDARRYALRILALAIIDLNPEVFGFEGLIGADPWEYDEVEVPGGVRLSLLGEAVGLSTAELRELNPALLRNQTPPDEPWLLRIPAGSYERFVEEYDALAERYGDAHEEVVLRFGETVEHLAERYGVSERVLRAINGMGRYDQAPYLEPLIVPLEGRSRTGEDVEDDGDLPVIITPPSRFAIEGHRRVFYEINPRDRIADIAEFFDTDIYTLAAWNDLDARAELWSGTIIQAFVPIDRDLSNALVLEEDEVRAFAVGSEEHTAYLDEEEAASASRTRSYTVESGDTVIGIARRFGVRSSDIIRWNDLDSNGTIIVGQRLVVGR